MSRVVVGLSGGVDSSVAAYLLQQEGHEVIGVFMRNWHDESVTLNNECPWIDDSNDALMVAEQLQIPFQILDLSSEYKQRIVDYMFAEYAAGRTPNPDVLCNREIKFDVFLKAAMDLGADYVATGHYCRREVREKNGQKTYHLLAGKDPNKDQSYFLCQVTPQQLSKALFPIGELQKAEVRDIAREAGLVTAEKKDSQGLCFIGKISLPDFLQQQLAPKKGRVVLMAPETTPVPTLTAPASLSAEDGRDIGEHRGAHYYTIGQRKGLGIGGFKEPLFVIGTDIERNLIFVGEGEKHPGLYRGGLSMDLREVNALQPDGLPEPGESIAVEARIRYRQELQPARLERSDDGQTLNLYFNEPQRGIAAGQFAAWYRGEELLGSGVIL